MIIEEQGDLFELDSTWALAHCVGNDFIMGKGIAIAFKNKYENQDWLLNNSKGIGTALLLSTKTMNVFYLITKKYSRLSKPSYNSIRLALIDMFKQANSNGIKKIGMPKIGCGLDGKNWDIVKQIIKETMSDDMTICVRYL